VQETRHSSSSLQTTSQPPQQASNKPSGLGEAYPSASNDTAGVRQLNRRVEIVVSDQGGQFPSTAERSASSTGWSESTSD